MLSVRVLVTAIAAVVLDVLFVLMLVQLELDDIYQENSLLECAQLLLLAAAMAAHAWRRRVESAAFDRRLFAGLGLLALAVFYRESDLRSLLEPGSLLSEVLRLARYVLAPALWLAAASALGCALLPSRERRRAFAGSDVALLLGCSAGMMAFAALLDKSVVHLAGPNRFYEELLEMNAYVALLGSAFVRSTCAPAQDLATELPLRKHPVP